MNFMIKLGWFVHTKQSFSAYRAQTKSFYKSKINLDKTTYFDVTLRPVTLHFTLTLMLLFSNNIIKY